MTEYLNQVVNTEKPWSFIDDTKENIINDLENYTLDPVFEKYGNFVNRNPQWINPEITEKYAGCSTIFGNFLALSHAFRLVTDDEALIGEIEEKVRKNQASAEYQEAKKRMMAEDALKAANLIASQNK